MASEMCVVKCRFSAVTPYLAFKVGKTKVNPAKRQTLPVWSLGWGWRRQPAKLWLLSLACGAFPTDLLHHPWKEWRTSGQHCGLWKCSSLCCDTSTSLLEAVLQILRWGFQIKWEKGSSHALTFSCLSEQSFYFWELLLHQITHAQCLKLALDWFVLDAIGLLWDRKATILCAKLHTWTFGTCKCGRKIQNRLVLLYEALLVLEEYLLGLVLLGFFFFVQMMWNSQNGCSQEHELNLKSGLRSDGLEEYRVRL